ncbi:DUF559 domain-containing protein [Thermoleophilia bacterium SCSIO 60948]|nr:DUF559 domain-containing protein [Thermoleophilia bacterium SCSIO 60948]
MFEPELSAAERWPAVARLASRQHGVVGLEQLRRLGIAGSTVRTWVERGRLFRVRRGVYAVGHTALTRESRRIAATLSVPGSALRCRTAASALGIRPTAISRIELVAPRRASGPGLAVRVSVLDPADLTLADAIPCTSVGRTIVDLAPELDDRGLERTVDAADKAGLFDLGEVRSASVRAGARHRGRSRLNRVLALGGAFDATESELEDRFLALVRTNAWPEPRLQHPIELGGERFRLDFFWPDLKLCVETDGARDHATPRAMRRDRRRDALLKAERGIDTLRFTWDQVTARPREVERVLGPLLDRAGIHGPTGQIEPPSLGVLV